MNIKTIKTICLSYLALLIIFYPAKIEIKCSDETFRDIAVGANEFNEFENKDSEWKDPNGDKLILGVINQVCVFIN